MTLDHWLSPAVMRPLGWALLHFLWQGTALAALAAVAMALCRAASVRYTLGVGVLVLMLAAPVATFLSYWRADTVATPITMPVLASVPWHAPPPVPGLWSAPQGAAPDIFPWLVEAWLLGVVFFSLRCTGGVLLLQRMRRRQALAIPARLLEMALALQRRLRLTRAIRYCECTWLEAPAVIGWFRPIILLPVTALTGLSEEQLKAVIAHELAHIKRLDAFVNAFQIAAETVLFYHPAVWWLNRRIRAERENSCDDVAIALCGNAVEYARALTLMEEWRSAPALAMAANRGPLTARIARLMGFSHLRSSVRGLGVTASLLCLTAALAAGIAIAGIVRPSAAAQSGATFTSAPSAAAPSAPPATLARPSWVAKPASAIPSPVSTPARTEDHGLVVRHKSVCKKSLQSTQNRQASHEAVTRRSSPPEQDRQTN
jgi:beta-lactamase regulating signal transducer with metallopeptidase domain